MKNFSKDDVELYHEHGFRQALPSVNVKCYGFGYGLDDEKLHCSESTFNKAMEYAFESCQETFWENAQDMAEHHFGKGIKIYSAGRSGGHLIVDGLDDVETWNAITLTKWYRFEKAIRDEVKYLSSDEYVKEEIESNKWNLDGAELFNFIEKKDGTSVCIAELKAQATAAGFSAVIR